MNARRHPDWIKARIPAGAAAGQTSAVLRHLRLATVCEEAQCPNRGECFGEGTATFMILGRVCTRRCRFCAVRQGQPLAPDRDEPQRLAQAARAMALRHVVITSVTRDDLADGGALHFRRCAEAVKQVLPDSTVEVLVPDFGGRAESLDEVLAAPIDVFNHNVETVPRLYPSVRPEADFERSLALLETAHCKRPDLAVKSGLMLGLGETDVEIADVLARLHHAGCSIVTLGQYLQPTRAQLPVARYVSPEEFDHWAAVGSAMGIPQILSGPMVRSSYHAGKCLIP